MIDTHCHLDSERFAPDREAVLSRAWAAGVSGLVVPAVGPAGWEGLLAWPERDPRVQVGLGIHPQLLPQLPASEDQAHLARLDALLALGVASAVGECGLDGPSLEGAPLSRQLSILEGHFALADKYRLPVLLHCYRAHPALRDFFKATPFPQAGVLLHSYSGGKELVRFYDQIGCAFSLAGPVTYPGARKPLEALSVIPPDRLMAETDAPDQAPHPHRGGRCEPAQLGRVVEAMARTLGEQAEATAVRTAQNARRFFRRGFGSG